MENRIKSRENRTQILKIIHNLRNRTHTLKTRTQMFKHKQTYELKKKRKDIQTHLFFTFVI